MLPPNPYRAEQIKQELKKNPGNPEPTGKARGEKSAFIRTLEIGESFDIKRSEQSKMHALFKNAGFKCKIERLRQIPDMIRVWRTE